MNISIIIPAYNAEKYIDKCMTSLLNQTSKDFEIICIDDGSEDRTLEKLNRYSENMKNLRIFSKQNEGAGIARNYGMKYVQGKYTLFLDIDDYLENDAIEKLNEIIKKEDIDFLFYNFVMESENGKIIKKYDFSNYKNCTKIELIKYMIMCTLPYGAHHLIKTDIYKKNQFEYSQKLKICEELVFKISCLNKSENIYFTDYVPYHYIKHPVSLSKNIKYISEQFNNKEKVIQEIEKILKENITDNEKYKVLINTFNVRETIAFSYNICKNNTGKFFEKYKILKEIRDKELFDENNKLILIDETLFTKRYKILYNIYKNRIFLIPYILFLQIYKKYDSIRQHKC